MPAISEKDIFHALMTSLEYGLSIQDREFNIIYQNTYSRNWFGDRTGKNKCYQAYEARDGICEGCPVEKAFRDGAPHDSERTVTMPTGEHLIFAISAVPIRDAEGNIIAGLEIVREITARKESEKQLAENERRLSALMNNLPGVAYRCRNDSNWTMEYLSNGCEALVGYTPTDLLENSAISFNDLIHPDDRQPVWASVQAALAEKKPYQVTYRVQTAQGEGKWVWEKGNGIFDPSGNILALEGFITDITEHKRIEQALQDSEIKYRTLVENSMVGVSIIQDNRYRFVNNRFCEITGYSYEELVDKMTPLDTTHGDDREAVAENLKKRLSGEVGTVHYTARKLRKDGGIRTVDIYGSSVVYRGRRAILGTIIDITEQKRAEHALQDSETKYRTLVENALVGVYIIQDTLFRFVNKRFCEIHGYSFDEIVDKLGPMDLVCEDAKDIVAENVRKRLDGEVDSVRYTSKALRKDGSIRIVEVFGSTTLYDGRKAILGTLIDITDQKRTEEILREQEDFLSSIVENIPNMLFIKDARDLRFIRVNRAGEEVMGHSREELIGKNDYDFFPKEQADFFTQKDREVLQHKVVCDIPEEPIDTSAGKRILHTKKIPILNDLGEPAFLLGISEDITPHKQAEKEREKLQAQLTQAQKMESVGRLAGGVAHDFNNMLSAILGYSEMALEQLNPADPLFGNLMEIKKAAKRSAELTKQLLAFARKQTAAPKILDLNETVESMLKMLRRLIGENINLVWVPGTGIHPILMDPSQVDQILANLCVNARDAIAGVGKIIIETRPVTFDDAMCSTHPTCTPGEHVMVSVSDTGSGMTKGILENLFEPFFTTKEQGKGTGLGLATVYGIVTQNNGLVHVYSEPEKGSTFKIYLPCHKTDQKPQQEEPEGAARPPRPGNHPPGGRRGRYPGHEPAYALTARLPCSGRPASQ